MSDYKSPWKDQQGTQPKAASVSPQLPPPGGAYNGRTQPSAAVQDLNNKIEQQRIFYQAPYLVQDAPQPAPQPEPEPAPSVMPTVTDTGAGQQYMNLFDVKPEPGQATTMGSYLIGLGKNVSKMLSDPSFGNRGPLDRFRSQPEPVVEEAPPRLDPKFLTGQSTEKPAKKVKPVEPDTTKGKDGAAGGGKADPAALPDVPQKPTAQRMGTNAFQVKRGDYGDAAYLKGRGIAVPKGGVKGEKDMTSSLPQGGTFSVMGQDGDSEAALAEFEKASAIRQQMVDMQNGKDPRSQAQRLLKQMPYGNLGDKNKRASMLAQAEMLLGLDKSDKDGQAALASAQQEQQNKDRELAIKEMKATAPKYFKLQDQDGNERIVAAGSEGAAGAEAATNTAVAELQALLEAGDITQADFEAELAALGLSPEDIK